MPTELVETMGLVGRCCYGLSCGDTVAGAR